MHGYHKEINFLDSFKVDTSIVPKVVNNLISDLKRCNCPQDEREEIVLAMDEAITNAIQETLFRHNCNKKEISSETHEITIRYRITLNNFDATIIDYGKGLDISKMLKTVPNKENGDYEDQLFVYAHKVEEEKLQVRINGKSIALTGIGVGLRIILSFMDVLTIDLIDTESTISSCVTDTTEGSILNMQRKRRY